MRVTDYIVKKLEDFGVSSAFLITGGGAMHLNDAFRLSSKIQCVTPHHEQAVAIAAEGYSRASGKLGVCVVTSGPGGTNTLTGVMGQYTDSVPTLYLSGQVKWETHKCAYPEIPLRQLGDQELDIISIVQSVTKYSTVLVDPKDVDKVIDEALYQAISGRPGPVWVDIPLNVQGAIISPSELEKGHKVESYLAQKKVLSPEAQKGISGLLEALKQSKRPVIVAGHGIRISQSNEVFFKLVNELKIPVVTTFNGSDNISYDHPYFCGRIGTLGSRSGNFAIQNSDLYISLGSRNNIRQVSYFWQAYAREAKVVLVDVDSAELEKPTLKADIKIQSDLFPFIHQMLEQVSKETLPDYSSWVDWCQLRYKKYDSVLPEYYELKDGVHPYVFVRKLTEMASDNATFVAANGSACVALFQASIVKKGQRHFWNSGCATMGYDLPAAIGAAVASGEQILCLAGDGSIMMNLQELVTIASMKLPIKIFVLENNGYQSIRQTQRNFFGLPYIGCGPESGVGFPDFVKLGEAIGLKTTRLQTLEDIESRLPTILKSEEGPMLIEVVLNKDYIFSPKLSSRKLPDGRMISEPLENMFPFLPREEFLENMIIEPLSEDR